jgi:hypothetical protein
MREMLFCAAHRALTWRDACVMYALEGYRRARWHQSAFALLLVVLISATTAMAQTQLDLSTQAKNVDFSKAISTKPVQVVSTLPASCSQFQIVFLTSAIPGQNLFFCTAANTWTQQSVSGSSTNVLAGFGVLLVTSGPLTYITVDTSVILSRATAQASTSNFCQSTSGTTNYACSLTPTLQAYTGPNSIPPGSTCLVLYVDVPNTASATLNVDHLGPVPILERSGATLSGGDIPASQPILACYSGSAFILQR